MSYINLPVKEAHHVLTSPVVQILDMRDEHSFKQGHFKGAVRAEEQHIKKLLKLNRQDTPIVIYCYRGNSSRDLSSFFISIGFKQVYNLEGGWEAWREYSQLPKPTQTRIPYDLGVWLQNHGFDPNNVEKPLANGMTALMVATLQENLSILSFLLENNIDVNQTNADGNNALWFACFRDNMDVIDLLIKNKINIDQQNANGATALIYSASAGKFPVVQRLIEAGADTNKVTHDDFSALDCASTLPILKLLRSFTVAA